MLADADIQKELVDPMARLLLSGALKDGDIVKVSGGDGALIIGKPQMH